MIRYAALAAVAALVASPVLAQTTTTTSPVGTKAPVAHKKTVKTMKSKTKGPAGSMSSEKKVTTDATPAGTKTTTTVKK